jgi:DNA-binding GntR family transcriptional regulator
MPAKKGNRPRAVGALQNGSEATDPRDPSSLAAEAYGIVRQRILRGELRMGQVISRRHLATELGMSFLPVTEALLRLEFEGLLESRPRAGTRVRIPSREDVLGHYLVREALEVRAATLFAQTATAADRAELKKLAQRVDLLSAQPDRTLFVILHNKLHQRIAECTKCRALCDAIEKTHALASTWYCITRQTNPDNPPMWHQILLAELSSGDAERAAAAVRDHIALGRDYAIEQLEPYFKLRDVNGKHFTRTAAREPRSGDVAPGRRRHGKDAASRRVSRGRAVAARSR